MPRNNRPRGMVTLSQANRLTFAQIEAVIDLIDGKPIDEVLAVRLTTARRKLNEALGETSAKDSFRHKTEDYWQSRINKARAEKRIQMGAMK